jgi:phage-related protein
VTAPAASAIELATAYVSVLASTDKMARGIKDAIDDGQKWATANPIDIKANIDVSHIGSIEIPATVDVTRITSGIHDALTDAQNYATANPIDIKANIDVSSVSSVRIPIEPDTFNFAQELSRDLRDMEHSGLFRFGVPVDVDTAAALAQFRALRDAMQGMASPIRQEVDVDVNRSALDSLSSLGSLGGIAKGAAGASAAAAGVAAIGGAAGLALGAVGALGIGLTALGPAAAAAAATITVGLSGVGDAFKALSTAEDAAGADGQAQAKAVAAAQEQVQTAIDGVATAQRSLSDAQKDAADAQTDLAQAYKDASDELEDYDLKVKGAALSQKEAELAVKKAREAVAKAKPGDREEALLRLERAELRLQEAAESNRDTQEAAAAAQAKGVEGSDKVVQAKERAVTADQKVIDAQGAVVKANDQVAKAQQAVIDAQNSSSSSADKAAQALAKLSPNAQAFVLATRDIAPAWNDLKSSVQDTLFDGAAGGITELANAALPSLKTGMVDVAGSMNGLAGQFTEFWKAPGNLAGIESIFAGTANFIDGLGPGLAQATTGILSIGEAFEPVANQVGAQVGGLFGNIGQAFTDAMDSGALTQLFATFGDIIQGLGEGIKPLIGGLIQMGNIVGPALGPLFKTLGESIAALAPTLGDLGATFATTLTAIMPDLTRFIDALLVGLKPVLPVIGDLLKSLMTALTPMIGPLSQIAQTVGTALTQAITALTPAIGPISDAFASLVGALAPILPVVAQVIGSLVQALAPALTRIFEGITPIIDMLGKLLIPVFERMMPIVEEVAGVLADALLSALEELAPILPPLIEAWSNMVMAILPIMPVFARMIGELLPPLVQLLVELTPAILKIAEMFTWLINKVIVPLVIPYIEQFGESMKLAMDVAKIAVEASVAYFKNSLENIGGFFSGLGDVVGKVWETIVKNIARGVEVIGTLLTKIPGIIPKADEAHAAGNALIGWAREHMATGGLLVGPGSGTSDSMLIAASTGEYIVRASATAKNLPLLEAINAGWVPTAQDLHTMIPGFAQGGMVPGKKFAESMDSATYSMGGFSRSSIDCSAMVTAVVNDALGLDPFTSPRMSTMNEGEWLKERGAQPGLGGPGDMAIAWFDRGGGANGHTAMRLSDGTGVESRSGDGVVIGSAATSVTNSMFDQHAHIPKELLLGGDGGATGGGSGGGSGALGSSLGGGTGGSSGGSGGTSGGSAGGGNTSGATNVFVTNWPNGLGLGTATGTSSTATSTTGTETATDSSTATTDTNSVSDLQPHPWKSLPVPGAEKLFDGPRPWYMEPTGEMAMASLETQAAALTQSGVSDVQKFFQDNGREMLETGAAVLGMGAVGPNGVVNNWQISGTDPMSAAAAVERVHRRQNLATMRSGGFSR